MESEDHTIGALKKKAPLTIFLIGQSGCGKNSITKKFIEHFAKIEPDRKVVVSETGEHFRNMIKTAPLWLRKDIEEIQVAGKFQSHHHAVMLTKNALYSLVETNDEHIIINGSPRSLKEANEMFDYLSDVYGRRVIIIYIRVCDPTARMRITKRNEELLETDGAPRVETANLGSINKKLAEFHERTLPALMSLPPEYVIEVDGEPALEIVFDEVLEKLAMMESRLVFS